MKTLRLGLEWFLNPDHLPLLIGLEEGWFADAGIALELIEPEAHMDAMDAIEAGRMDVAITEPIHLVEDRAKGQQAVGFARFLHTNGGVMYLNASGIQRPRDMANARIQYPGAPGPGGKAIVATMVEADGGQVGELTPVNRGFAHTDALLDGDADVATLAFYNFEVVEARLKGHKADFFALRDWGVPDFCQLVLTTSVKRLEDDRETFSALLKVLRRGMDVIHQNPARAREIYFRRTETDPNDALMSAIFAATVPCFTFDLSMSAEYYTRLVAWMHDRGLIDTEVDPNLCWSNALAFG
ncbi:MAG: ABC transporter substrate-binding protein [Myxococcota bacterium]